MKNSLFTLGLGLVSAVFLNIVQAQTQTTAPFNLRAFPYTDVHMHASLKPFNSRHTGDYNLWDKIDHNCEGELSDMFVNGSKEVPRTSQCHFEGLVRGNVRIGYLSLTPMEKKMFHANFLNEKKKGLSTMACVSGVMFEKMVEKDESINYYEDLVENIRFVKEGEKVPHYIDGKAHTYEIIKTARQLEEVLKDPSKIAVLFNIEGGHALGHSLEPNDISQTMAYENFYMSNVDRLKGIKPLKEGTLEVLEYPFLSININHFFWNGLGGHARTFGNAQNLVFGQNKGMDMSVTPLGEKVIKRLLDKKEGRRVLVDVKHMSLDFRKWYYNYLETLRKQGDTVAIISSHSTVAGCSWDNKDFLKKDNDGKLKNSYLFNWTISLTDEDIRQIHTSKGVIGIILDKYRLIGDLGKKAIDETIAGSIQRRQLYAKILWMNIFCCIKAVNQKSGWDIVAIGSDFDGMITPFETWQRANDMPDMAKDLYDYLKNPTDIFNLFTKEEIQRLMFGLTPEEIMYKLMYDNGLQFALRNLPK